METLVGQHFGHYRLVRLLGRGGFADVYLGEHMFVGSQAAIKILTVPLPTEAADGFLNEARTLVRLTHPHIIRFLDYGIEGRTPFLVMDYAPSGTLRELHPRGKRLPLTTVVGYVKEVAAALQYTHNERLIHRDVKPANLLLNRHRELLLSDFGIAVIAHSSRSQRIEEIVGTISYMAPEQIQGKPCRASDQYSLGVITYEWLTGNCPFSGSFAELVEAASAKKPGASLKFEFDSLTTFNRSNSNTEGHDDYYARLPLPQYVFPYLAKCWQDLAPSELTGIVQKERIKQLALDEGIVITDYDLKPHTVKFTTHWQQGFVGICTYHLLGHDSPATNDALLTMRQQVALLGQWAFYCGVGYKTAMGMGQVRLLK